MTGAPASNEIAGALGRFFTGGSGPRHSDLSSIFAACGFGDVAPYVDGEPNKETRVKLTINAAARHPHRARGLIDSLLAEMRAHRCFDPSDGSFSPEKLRAAQDAFRRAGWRLSKEGELESIGAVDLETGGRAALDEQLARLRKATDDPALLLGSAKDLLESVAKFVLEELGIPVRRNADFNELWHHARDRLGLLPGSLVGDDAGTASVRRVLGAAWTIAEQVNVLRGSDGTGHGRTLPTGVSAEIALFVVREACSVAELTLRSLDRHRGR